MAIRAASRRGGDGVGAALIALVRRRPLDSAGVAVAAGLATAIVVNALTLQVGHHHAPTPHPPAPVARPVPPPQVAPLPRAETPMPAVAETPAPAPAAAAKSVPTATALVESIQAELKRRGVYRDKIDGTLGPKTEAAIKSYQIVAGLAPSGQPSDALLAALRGAGRRR